MPVHAAALPSFPLQDSPLLPAPGDGDFPLAAGRAWRGRGPWAAGRGSWAAGHGSWDRDRAELWPLPTARQPGAARRALRWHRPVAAAVEGRREPGQGVVSFWF